MANPPDNPDRPPSGNQPLDYKAAAPTRRSFSWLRVIGLLFLILLGTGLLIFGICTLILIHH